MTPIWAGVRQDVLVATEVDEVSSDDDFASWAAYRKAEKSIARKVGTGGGKDQGG